MKKKRSLQSKNTPHIINICILSTIFNECIRSLNFASTAINMKTFTFRFTFLKRYFEIY